MSVTEIDHLSKRDIASFWAKVDRIGGPDACWEWQGGRTDSGYGVFSRQRKGEPRVAMRAHRMSYLLTEGQIPADKPMILHGCDNRSCCNPKHLKPGTAEDNARDVVNRGRHWTTLRPETIPRGKDHWSNRYPDRVPSGENHGNAKLTSEQVADIRRMSATPGMTQRDLASKFNVSQTLIWAILTRRIWNE